MQHFSFGSIGGKQATTVCVTHESLQPLRQQRFMTCQQYPDIVVKILQGLRRIFRPALGQLMVERQVNNDAGVTPEFSRELPTQLLDLTGVVRESIDTAVQLDPGPDVGRVLPERADTPHKVSQQSTNHQPFIIAGEVQVGQEIHVRTLSQAGVRKWLDDRALRYDSTSRFSWPSGMTGNLTMERQQEFPPERTEFLLAGPAGALECIADVPEPEVERPGTIVLCHPHPQHGGTMHNKVVTILERSMRELGLRTVRFNFRGVGDSEGQFDDGYGETDDLFAVAEWVRQTRPDDGLWLGGFSFGAYIALRAAQNLRLGQLISIAPAVNRYEFSALGHPNCPWLIIQGDEDDVVPVADVRSWVKTVEPPPEFIVMREAGHFFHRRLMDLRGLLKNGVMANLPTADHG